ncbi:MAG: rhomboid family intramembrane serine protease [Planctomycetes bacterium]|nr:rhomboid family intramembrane serine protease [Planctomycetota bacterium]
MGLDDRDYMTQDGAGSSTTDLLRRLPAAGQLIILNLLVFLAWHLFHRSGVMLDHFMVDAEGLRSGRVWTLVTYAFSHREPWHLFWNMLFLYWFGGDLEAVWGKRNLWAIYLVGAVGGAAAQVAFNLHQGTARPMLGASASVMAIVVATTLMFPTRRLMIWGVIPTPMWVLAALYLLVDVFGLAREMTGAFSRVGHAGHLGGAVAGALFQVLDLRPFRRGQPAPRGRQSAGPLTWLATAWRRRRLRVLPPLPREERAVEPAPVDPAHDARRVDPAVEARVDELLRKINAEGLQSLTNEEKAFLERASTQYRK